MPIHTRFISTLRSLFRKAELDRDLEEELKSYLEMLAAEKIRAGMSVEQAHREARLELGGVEQVKEKVRERRLGSAIDTVFQDVRYSFRTLSKNRGFTFVAVLILAIGIGANTALFSNIHTALLRAIPYTESDRLVAGLKTEYGQLAGTVSMVDLLDYQELSGSFDGLAALAYFTMEHTILGGDRPELIQASYVTWNLFPLLGVRPAAGRLLTAEDDANRGAPVVLISYGLWQRRFGGALDAVGGTLLFGGTPVTVVGVMPPEFRFQFDADAWLLTGRAGPFDTRRDSHSHLMIGRLKRGVTLQEARSELDVICRNLAQQYPESNTGKGVRLWGLQSFIVRDVRTSLLLLMATSGLVLIIACANVAGLLLARGERRRSELAMRSALGASRGRLVRQLLTESIILTLMAGIAGVGVAFLLQDALVGLLPVDELAGEPAGISSLTLAFTGAVALLTGLLVGTVPALRDTATGPAQDLRTGTRASDGVAGSRVRSGLVVLQVAVSIALLVGSGLLIRSLAHLSAVELGFDPSNLLTAQLQIQVSEYPTPDERNQFFASLLEEVESLPGVVSANLSSKLPFLSRWQNWSVWPAGEPSPTSPRDGIAPMVRWVSPGYFETMGIPLLSGRDISATDLPGGPLVAVLSEGTARAVFPDGDAIGRRVHIGWDDREFQVVGLVPDARINTLRGAPDAAAYMSAGQLGATRLQIAVRTADDPMSLVGPIEDLVRRKDPTVVLARPATMTSVLEGELGSFRILIVSLVLFAGVALLLTAIGLYGILAYYVRQRTSEIGIRLALGASNGDLLGMILKRGMVLVVIGLALGVAAAYPGTLLIRQLLFETPPLDPAAYVGAIGFLGLVAALACFLPAWRATRVDVAEVLRIE